ncbi:hypothetical protein [Nesterenkonia muleiensis]|nr:hypothetical protein [Nesterenkonia muleiensis]
MTFVSAGSGGGETPLASRPRTAVTAFTPEAGFGGGETPLSVA